MKKRILSLTMALVMALSLSLPAMAAEDTGIAVQLNGKNIEFVDAAPISKDNRTFLPARAVFEAMGATITYEDATQTVTATREGVTVTMTVGSTDAIVTVGELPATTLTMDVAPFIQDDHTYVPVRFAANAFGCDVGWDQGDQTVVLVDTAKMMSDTMAKHKYTWLEKYDAYMTKFNGAKWAVDGTVKGDVSMNANSLVAFDMAMKGLMDGQKSAQITVNMNMDMTGLMNFLVAALGSTAEAQGLSEADMKQNVTMETRVDMETGMIYMLPDDNYCAKLGVEKGTWLSMDMSAILGGLDTAELMNTASFLATVAPIGTDLNDKDTAYQNVVAELDKYYAAISDDGFKKVTGGYSTTIDLADATTTASAAVMLYTNSKDEVTGYKLTMDASADMTELKGIMGTEAAAQLAAMGLNIDTLKISMVSGMDSANKSTVEMTIDLGNTASVKVSGDIQYAASTKTVEAVPPAGSKVVDLFSLAAAAEPAPIPAAA